MNIKKAQIVPIIILSALFISACSGTNSSSESNIINDEPIAVENPVIIPSESPIHSVTINADGVDEGEHIYTLIGDVLGESSMETPDFYDADHTDVEHIYEDFDDEVGDHFVMTLHRDLDGNKGVFEGRQRNEIKVYGSSDDILKGFENTTFEYSWKMKINDSMTVSGNFTHFFQLKPKGGDDSTPTFTITGANRSNVDVVEIRYQVPDIDDEVLATVEWDTMRGQWLEIYLKATYAEHGSLEFTISQLSDGEELVSLSYDNIDLWIGESDEHYQRPKWGIVRSLEDLKSLRSNEETVRFANIEINKY